MKLGKLVCCWGICLALLLGMTNLGFCQVATQEWKLLIKPTIFADSREAGYQLIAERIAAMAASSGMVADLAVDKEKCRYIRYFDTIQHDLAKAHYILRQRVKVKKGVEQNYGDLTLKLRLAAFDQLQADTFAGSIFNEKVKSKVEADTVGFIDNQIGKAKTSVSLSATYKEMAAMTVLPPETIEEYFPILAANPVSLADDLVIIGQTLEYSTELGEIAVSNAGEALTMDIVVWYDPIGSEVQIAELSWKSTADDINATQLFNALQENLPDILQPGQTKTAYLTN